MDRRQFVLATAATGAHALLADEASDNNNPTRVAVIGHTGRGDYGHGLDTVWKRIASTKIVAVADANAAGLEKRIKRLNLDKAAGFADYPKMLQSVRPDVVAVCPRHADQHHDMILAAIESGCKGIYVEKPFVRTPGEADAIVKACQERAVKLAIAHRNRYHPVLKTIDKLIADGILGRLLAIRGRGKSDRRGGVEDLWVLGSHTLNLITYFGGQPKSCSAVLMQDGKRATKDDVRITNNGRGNEGLGAMAGNELHARFVLDSGIVATFDSIANDGTANEGFGLRLIGSKGVIDIHCDATPLAHLMVGNPFKIHAENRSWLPISTAGVGKPEPIANLRDVLYSHEIPVRQLLDSISKNTRPLCNEKDGRTIVEMICAVMQSHQDNGVEITFPMQQRKHPLSQ